MSIRNLERWLRATLEDVASLEAPKDLEERFGRYREDPAGFVREKIGADPEPYQAEILEEAGSGVPRIAWRAGHGVGKTAVLAWLLLWWLLTRPFARVLVLAPAYERQVGRYLFPEVKKWARGAPEPLPVKVRASSVEVEGFEREWFALAVQASDSAKVEGAHAGSVMVLADEAKGLPSEVVAALHGTQTDLGGDRLFVLVSVPGGPSGPFYDVFRKGAKLWKLCHTSARDSRLVSEEWVRERAEEWGEGSPLFLARVLGEFPEEAEGTLLRLSDLEAAVGRELEEEGVGVALGVDVARFGGDRSAVARWRGATLEEVTARGGLDTMEVAAWVAGEINRTGAVRTRVDEIGLGSGVVDRLRQLDHAAEGVNVSARPSDPSLFLNLRSEIAWRFREALERGDVSLPEDEGLLAELSSLRYGYDGRGRIKLEDKDMTKKRVGRSPDLADAALLGFGGAGLEEPARFFAVGGTLYDMETGEVVEMDVGAPDSEGGVSVGNLWRGGVQ